MAVRRFSRVLVAGIPLGGVSVLLFRMRRLFSMLVALVAIACDKAAERGNALLDDFGDSVSRAAAPRRIVSLSPATTEMLFTIGAGSRVVGRSKYDLWPDSATRVPSLGDGMRPNVEAVLGVHPDLVVLYASQDNRAAADKLRAASINTLALRQDHIADFRRALTMLGRILRDSARAQTVIDSVFQTLDRVRSANTNRSRPKVFWHVWDAPLITIGSGSFMDELVEIAGAKNVYADIKGPSGQVSLEDVARRDPDFILAGPVGAEAIRSDPRWRIVRAARENRILVVDTGLVARPSVRLGEAAVSLARLLHPDTAR